MMSHSTGGAGICVGDSELRSTMECLSYLTAKFFESQVTCAHPGGACSRIGDTIRFLERNFEREERTMIVVGYPEAVRHAKQHQDLLRRLTKMKHALVCSGYDNTMLFELITDWQKSHIPRFDEPLARYLRDFAIKSASEGV